MSEKEVTNELVGFVHAVSKPMHFLSPSLREGLYIGGDPVIMTATTILVALLQENDHIPGEVQVVNYTGNQSRCSPLSVALSHGRTFDLYIFLFCFE